MKESVHRHHQGGCYKRHDRCMGHRATSGVIMGRNNRSISAARCT